MLFFSSKRARNSIRTVTSFSFSIASSKYLITWDDLATRYNVILMDVTSSSFAAYFKNPRNVFMDSYG